MAIYGNVISLVTIMYLSDPRAVLHIQARIEITEGPQSVQNALLGSTVDFKCVAKGTIEDPIWSIDGKEYWTYNLPLYHNYFSGYLEIFPVIDSMNGSEYYCHYLDYSDGGISKIESEHAILYVDLTSTPNTESSTFSLSTDPGPRMFARTKLVLLPVCCLLILCFICVLWRKVPTGAHTQCQTNSQPTVFPYSVHIRKQVCTKHWKSGLSPKQNTVKLSLKVTP